MTYACPLLIDCNKACLFGARQVKEYIEKRALEIAQYIIETGSTVREAARAHKVSKSTVHKDMSERLPRINVQMCTNRSNASWRRTRRSGISGEAKPRI